EEGKVVQRMGKEVDELKAERIAKTQDPLALMANSKNPYAFPAPHQDQSSFNQNYLQKPMPNPEDITDPPTAMNMELVLMAKEFKLNYSTPTNNNQRISSNPRNRQIAQPGMNMGQDRQMQMVGGNGGNQFRQYARNSARYNDVIGNQVIRNVVQNPRVQNTGNQNGLIGVQGNVNQNQIRNGNLVARAEENAAGPRKRDAAYLQTQLLIAQKEEAGIQLQAEEYDLMAAPADLDEIKEVIANCILMANMQQASTSGTQTDSDPVYDSDRSAEVHENCKDNEIFNMFTQEEQYIELLEPIPESHQVPQNDNDVISEDTSVEQGNGNQNQIGNGKLVAARAEENAAGKNGNQIRCYNYRGVGHFARDCTVRPRRMDAAYLQIQLLIAQKEEAGIQLQAEEYDLMAAAADIDEIEEVNTNCILMANLQQASSSGTQTDSTPVYEIDTSAMVHENYDNNEIFNMFTQEEQYTELLKPIPEP
nr:hypothetical protein [Tanacetum cinerariifolium]